MTPDTDAELRQALAAIRQRTDQLDRLIEHLDGIAAAKVLIERQAHLEHAATLDELIAHAHGGPRPALTQGARAILATTARETR